MELGQKRATTQQYQLSYAYTPNKSSVAVAVYMMHHHIVRIYYSSAFTFYPHSISVSIFSIRLHECFVTTSNAYLQQRAIHTPFDRRNLLYRIGRCVFRHGKMQPFVSQFHFENWLQWLDVFSHLHSTYLWYFFPSFRKKERTNERKKERMEKSGYKNGVESVDVGSRSGNEGDDGGGGGGNSVIITMH